MVRSLLLQVLLAAVLCFCLIGINAEDAAPADVEVSEDAAPADDAAPAAEGEAAATEADGAAFLDSAKELQEKLAQLKSLLDSKGEAADPALRERLAGLEQQLKGLGLEGLGGGGVGSNKELTEFLNGCVALAMRKTGVQRPTTLGALRQMAEKKLDRKAAAKMDLWRMVAVCVGDFSEEEFADFKSGKMKTLPKAHVDASKKPEAEQKVMDIEESIWEELRAISGALVSELGGGEAPPMSAGWIAVIPLVIMLGFIVKLFRDMQKNQQAREDKAAKKEAKKGK